MKQLHMTVGVAGSDIEGFSNQHIQSAIDRVAFLGGGTVVLSVGVFDCADSVHLRSNVCLRGQGTATVLRKNAMKSSRLNTYIAYAQEDLLVDEPELFAIGDGYIMTDDRSGGFHDTQGTIIATDGPMLIASVGHESDYLPSRNGILRTLYAVLSVKDENNVHIEHIRIDGNAQENESLNGCRGGAFFAHFSDDVTVNDVVVEDFNGEGFSFQTCDRMHIFNCRAERCSGNGFHPGSGSRDFHIHDCHAHNNKESGLFYCVRVRDGLLENCEFTDNDRFGVSIGQRDVRSVNRNITVRDNGGAGFYFRGGPAEVCSHDTMIEACTMVNNGKKDKQEQVYIQGPVHGVQICNNTIEGATGIYVAADVAEVQLQENTFNCQQDLSDQRS